MKRWIIIVLSALLLIFLAIRGIYKKATSIDDEKHWYVSQLHYNCSLKIDTIITFNNRGGGGIICRLVAGKVSDSLERSVNKKLRYHKRLRLLHKRNEKQYVIETRRASNYAKGDSIHIDTSKDEIQFFRDGKSFWIAKASNSLLDVVF